MIAYQAGVRGDHQALVEGEAALSFEALERQVGCWANCFASLGLAPGDCISLRLTDTTDHVIALLAAMRARLPFLCLNWKASRHEVESRTAKLGRRLVLCHVERNLPAEVGVLCGGDGTGVAARASGCFPLPTVSAGSTVLLAAGSGTTGRPSRPHARNEREEGGRCIRAECAVTSRLPDVPARRSAAPAPQFARPGFEG